MKDDFRGVRRFDKELINLLKEGGSFSGEEILHKSKHRLFTIQILIKAVNSQLEVLESYGLVEYARERMEMETITLELTQNIDTTHRKVLQRLQTKRNDQRNYKKIQINNHNVCQLFQKNQHTKSKCRNVRRIS